MLTPQWVLTTSSAQCQALLKMNSTEEILIGHHYICKSLQKDFTVYHSTMKPATLLVAACQELFYLVC